MVEWWQDGVEVNETMKVIDAMEVGLAIEMDIDKAYERANED